MTGFEDLSRNIVKIRWSMEPMEGGGSIGLPQAVSKQLTGNQLAHNCCLIQLSITKYLRVSTACSPHPRLIEQ
jgi:hypothetical protein